MASKRIHDTSPRESLDKAILFLAFIVGAIGTIWLKLVEMPVLVVALFPVLVLIAYVGACLTLRSIGTEPETIGDNSYYLGFLFTLSSLAVTLYRIRDIGAEDVDLIPLVISGFGVALSSTIAGVFLRVFLLQLRPDIVARDRAARRDLAAGARDLREAMAGASRQLKSIAIETQQHVAERNGQMSQVLEVQIEKTSELLDRQSRAYDDLIRDFGTRLTAEITQVLRRETARAAEEINRAAKSFAENLDDLGRSRKEAEAELVSSLEVFRELINDIRETTAQHGKVTEASYTNLAAQSQKVSQSLAEASDTVQTALSMSLLVVEEAQRAAGESRSRLRDEEAHFRRHSRAVIRSAAELERAMSDRLAEIARQPSSIPKPREQVTLERNEMARSLLDQEVLPEQEPAPTNDVAATQADMPLGSENI